jgi:hypothetical protein
VLPSVKVPVAVNCCVVARPIETFAGLTAIDTRFGAFTVSDDDPEICPTLAEIEVVPCPALVARPALPGVLLTTATAANDELHSTVAVTSCTLLSLYEPVAKNCCVVPSAIAADCGVIAMESKTAGVTVKVAVPLTLPETALIVDVPVVRADANPCDPEASLIVAIFAEEEVQ